MKTPMQELIERLECLIGLSEGTKYEKGLKYAKEQAESMLEKEENVMCEFTANYTTLWEFQPLCGEIQSIQQYYNETFNTKER
jgi:hypothetical protein